MPSRSTLTRLGSRDFIEGQSVRVDQEVVLAARHARRKMRKDQIVPPEMCNQTICGGQRDSLLPFFGRNAVTNAI